MKLVRNREVSSNSCVKFDFADGRVKGMTFDRMITVVVSDGSPDFLPSARYISRVVFFRRILGHGARQS